MTATMLEAALRGLALALVVGLCLRVLRVRNVPARKAAWTLVLVASLAMPALMRWPVAARLPGKIGWTLPFTPTRVVQPQSVAQPTVPLATQLETSAVRKPAPLVREDAPPGKSTLAVIDGITATDASLAASAPPRWTFHWPPMQRIVVWFYLGVTGALLLRLLIGLGWAVRIWSTAEPVSPLIAPEPHVRASCRIPSPVTIGSGIVLPAEYPDWDRQKLRMVLAHERSHVRQMDFYLQLVAGLYTAFFWFSPVGWWLRRTLASLGEAIGDRAGMEAAASRSRYAQVVLEFAAAPRGSLPGVAMACTGNLSRRVESMLNENWFRSAFAEGRRRAFASLLLIPAALFAVTALVRVPAAAAQAAPAAQTQPTAPAPSPATGQSNPPEDQVTTTVPLEQQNPAAPPAPPAPAAQAPSVPAQAAPAPGTGPAARDMAPPPPDQQTPAPPPPVDGAMGITRDGNAVTITGPHRFIVNNGDQVSGYGFHFSSDGDSYALVEGPGNNLTFSGDWNGDLGAQIERARRSTSGPFLWFTHNGKSYIVTDPAIVAQIQHMYEPMADLSAQQRLLGKQQEALGKEQGDLARAQREASQVRMPDLSQQMADLNEALANMKADEAAMDAQKLAAIEAQVTADVNKMLTPEKLAEIQQKIAQMQAQWTPERWADLQAKLGDMQARLGELEGEAGEKAAEAGSRMGELGAKQGELGEEQGRLGEQQGKLAEDLDRQVQKIIQQTLANGKASPVQ